MLQWTVLLLLCYILFIHLFGSKIFISTIIYIIVFGSYAIQDPMRGGKDDMFEDVVAIIHADDQEARAKDAVAPPRRRLVPEFMLKLARSVSPFWLFATSQQAVLHQLVIDFIFSCVSFAIFSYSFTFLLYRRILFSLVYALFIITLQILGELIEL